MTLVITRNQGKRIVKSLGMKATILPDMPLIPLFGDIIIEMAERIAKLEARVSELECKK
jgi:hypothetical protein